METLSRIINQNKKLIWIFYFLILFIFSFRPNFLSKESYFKGDPLSYLAHSMTIALDWDLNYENELHQGREINDFLPVHPIGPGILAAPFVYIFSLIDKINKHPVINNHQKYKYSWIIVGFIFATYVYFFLGVILYDNSLKIIFNNQNNLLLLLLICSTGILYYVLNVPVLSHSFEFFSISLLLYLSLQIIIKEKIIFQILYPIVLLLNLIVRYNNLNLILLPFIILLFYYLLFPEKIDLKIVYKKLILFLMLTFFGLLLYSIFCKYFINTWYPSFVSLSGLENSKGIGSENIISIFKKLFFMLPNLTILFFGSEFGLIYSNPILIFSFIGFNIFLFKNMFTKNKKSLFWTHAYSWEELKAFLPFFFLGRRTLWMFGRTPPWEMVTPCRVRY